MPRQAGSCRLSQTLGITVAVSLLERDVPPIHAADSASASASLRFAMLGKFTAQGHEVVSFFRASRRWASKCHLWQGRLVHSALSSLQPVRHAPSQFVVATSRRSAAPGSQFGGAAGYGSSGFRLVVRQAPLAASAPGLIVRPVLWLAIPAMPNPSIERTSPGKPGAASHVKR
jgi:hypothetical protein